MQGRPDSPLASEIALWRVAGCPMVGFEKKKFMESLPAGSYHVVVKNDIQMPGSMSRIDVALTLKGAPRRALALLPPCSEPHHIDPPTCLRRRRFRERRANLRSEEGVPSCERCKPEERESQRGQLARRFHAAQQQVRPVALHRRHSAGRLLRLGQRRVVGRGRGLHGD